MAPCGQVITFPESGNIDHTIDPSKA